MAVEVLKSRGVPEDRILFLNLIASPEGINNFATKFPKLRVVTAFVDQVRTVRPIFVDRDNEHADQVNRDWMKRSSLTYLFIYRNAALVLTDP